jgi:hypothetical protein
MDRICCVALACLLLTACGTTSSRLSLGFFTGDEHEVAYLQYVRLLSPTSLQTEESVHKALSLYRDTKVRQQALFRQFSRQYPQATPEEMTTLVREALLREPNPDLPSFPPPAFLCSSVNMGKTESLSCN